MVTAMNTIEHRIEGLDNGADDYLVKPFAMEELFASHFCTLFRGPSLVRNTVFTYDFSRFACFYPFS